MTGPDKWVRVGKSTFRWPVLKSASSQGREDSVRADLTSRLTHICQHLSRADFAALITKMTLEQLRSEGVALRAIQGG
jgi:hypothetical protein